MLLQLPGALRGGGAAGEDRPELRQVRQLHPGLLRRSLPAGRDNTTGQGDRLLQECRDAVDLKQQCAGSCLAGYGVTGRDPDPACCYECPQQCRDAYNLGIIKQHRYLCSKQRHK